MNIKFKILWFEDELEWYKMEKIVWKVLSKNIVWNRL